MGSDDLLTVAQNGGDPANRFEVNDHQGFKRLWAPGSTSTRTSR